MRRIGKALKGTRLATTLMENGGRLPSRPSEEIHGYGFQMIVYPTTVLFRITRAIEQALTTLKRGKPLAAGDAVTLDEFEQVVGLPAWQEVEDRFQTG